MPVGARIRVESPRTMAGQPSNWGAVGASKTARNQAMVMGWKPASAVLESTAWGGCGEGRDSGRFGLRGVAFFGFAGVGGIAPLLSQQSGLDAIQGRYWFET